MRPVRAILIYLVAIFLGSALIAPPIYFIINEFSQHSELCNRLVSRGFHKFLSRSMMVIAIVGLIPLLRSLGFKSLAEVGLAPFKNHWKQTCYGFLFGFFTLSVPVIASLLCGDVSLNPEKMAHVPKHLLNAGFSAIVVSFLEELLFRGGIMGSVQRFYEWRFALAFSSAIYAIVHFFAKIERLTEIHWYSGFVGILTMFRGFLDLKALIPGFLNLFLVGIILGIFFKRFGNLYFSIGTHAGWIFWLKIYGFFAVFNESHNVWLFGSAKLVDGWLTFFVLLPLALALGYKLGSHKSENAGSSIHTDYQRVKNK